MTLKQHEATEKNIGDNTFYIRPFAALTCATVSGDIISTLSPVGSLIGVVAGGDDLENIDISALTPALASVDGGKLADLLRTLLIKHSNISVVQNGDTVRLTEDLANEIFCTGLDDMVMLAWEVCKLNFAPMFGKRNIQFGNLIQSLKAANG